MLKQNAISEKFSLTFSEAINNHQNKLVVPFCHRAISKRSLACTNYELWTKNYLLILNLKKTIKAF